MLAVATAVGVEGAVQRDGAAHARRRAGEGDQEAVAAQLHLEAAVGLALGAHDAVVVLDDPQRLAVAQALHHARVVVHVAEHQRHAAVGARRDRHARPFRLDGSGDQGDGGLDVARLAALGPHLGGEGPLEPLGGGADAPVDLEGLVELLEGSFAVAVAEQGVTPYDVRLGLLEGNSERVQGLDRALEGGVRFRPVSLGRRHGALGPV